MNKKPIIAFCPADAKNEKLFIAMQNSLRKWHSEAELPLIRIDENRASSYNDPMFWYRATPIIAKELLQEYQTIIKIDADCIVLNNLSHTWEHNDFDIAAANNSSPADFKNYSYTFQNINPLAYLCNAYVVIKNEDFVNCWYDGCQSVLYNGWQMKEQDVLNIFAFLNHYKIKHLDEGDCFHGMAAKGYEPFTKLIGDKVILPKNANGEDGWPDKDKQLCLYHYGGGNDPVKGNYRVLFPEDVSNHIAKLITNEN